MSDTIFTRNDLAIGSGGGNVRISIGPLYPENEPGETYGGDGAGKSAPAAPAYPLIPIKEFSDSSWDSALLADAAAANLLGAAWLSGLESVIDPPNSDPTAMSGEIACLIRDSALRQERGDEILLQTNNLDLYWANAIGGPSIRPLTWKLVQATIRIGGLVGMHFKFRFKRPRPVQVYPAIMPMFLTPLHPSYPNNHALQSLLVAGVIGKLSSAMTGPMRLLALRIGHNREIAGVHFPSDRVASQKLADALLPKLTDTTEGLFHDLLAAAADEWK
jgi:membrane-associated phospholipid phosphatase